SRSPGCRGSRLPTAEGHGAGASVTRTSHAQGMFPLFCPAGSFRPSSPGGFAMAFQTIELPLACHGHVATVWASLAQHAGWEVCATLDDRILETVHCADWHRVERFRSRLERHIQSVESPGPRRE